MRKSVRIIFPLAVFSILIGTIAAVVLFQQQFPQVSVVSTLSSNCGNLTNQSGTVVNGTAKDLTFNCGGSAAFTVTTQGKYIPTFTLPAAFTTLSITNGTSFVLTNTAQITLSVGTYSYIAHYGGAFTPSPISGFSITWSQ